MFLKLVVLLNQVLYFVVTGYLCFMGKGEIQYFWDEWVVDSCTVGPAFSAGSEEVMKHDQMTRVDPIKTTTWV